MDTEHLNEESEVTPVAENETADVPHISRAGKLLRSIAAFPSRLGLSTVKVLARICLILIRTIGFVLAELADLLKSLLKALWSIVKLMLSPFKNRMNITAEMQRSLRKAKKAGGAEYRRELIRCICKFLFDENGVFCTAFNYILPIVSVGFFIAVIRYGAGQRYGLSVECNGKEIGVISAESTYDEASSEVRKRVAFNDDENEFIDLSPKFSLRIISDDERVLNPDQLANEILASSNSDLIEASGIYVDGEFIGAVKDTQPVEEALTDILLNYKADGIVKEVSFKNKVEYNDGIYLAESLMTEDDAIKLLTSQKQKIGTYVAQKGDTPLIISMKFNMDQSQFNLLNPNCTSECKEGQIVRVTEKESYLPILYIRELETLSFLDYETIEVETSSLNVGTRRILQKGERGEKRSSVEITYIDGIERSRKVIKSEVIKSPTIEQVGVGTYTARPASSSTVLTGSGQFGWPVNGGYISDPFISNRNHKGLDIAAPGGTDIYAGGDGVVVAAGWNPHGYGYFVEIDHMDGYQTVYAHCSSLFVSQGQSVTRGQLIAAVGTTGNSTGNHCHFEVRYLGMIQNPADYLNTVNAFDDE